MKNEWIIAPSLFSSKISRLEETLAIMKQTNLHWLHVDVMDGCFVPDLASGPSIVKELKEVSDCLLDVHLMVSRPEKVVARFLEAGADSLTYHVEATDQGMHIIQQVKAAGKKVGVAINPATPVSAIQPVLAEVDLVLVMTINPGTPGKQDFIASTKEKIKELQQFRETHNHQYIIEVDGKIDDKTIVECAEVGTEMFVSGGYIFGESGKEGEKIKALQTALTKAK